MKYHFLVLLALVVACDSSAPPSGSHASKSELLPNEYTAKAEKIAHQLPERFSFEIPPPPPPFCVYPEPEIEVIDFPEISPAFPGGSNELNSYLVKNLKYPAMALEMGIQGKVYVEFSVMQDGSIDDIKILRGIDQSLDKEAIRVLKNMPKWMPAESEGRRVKRTVVLPIRFEID